MPDRVSPTDRIRGHIDELFASGKQPPQILEDVARLGARLLMQAALEAEITEFLGRDRYQRAAACEDARPGSRNGYREVTVKTTAGPATWALRRIPAALTAAGWPDSGSRPDPRRALCHVNLAPRAGSSPRRAGLWIQRHRALPLHQHGLLPNHVQTTRPTTCRNGLGC